MLTNQAYLSAFAIYIVAALVALVVFARWLPDRWPGGVRWAIYGFLGGMLLTPALPGDSATTLAPALIVVVFNSLFGEGWDSAVPAAAVLLAVMVGGCVVGGVAGTLLNRKAAAINADGPNAEESGSN